MLVYCYEKTWGGREKMLKLMNKYAQNAQLMSGIYAFSMDAYVSQLCLSAESVRLHR